MAKKPAGGTSSVSPKSETSSEKLGTRITRLSERTAKTPSRKAEVGGRRSEVCHPSSVTCRPSFLLDTRVICCGDNLEQLAKLPDACNSSFRTPHFAIAVAGSFYYHCDWHASHYVNVMLDHQTSKN